MNTKTNRPEYGTVTQREFLRAVRAMGMPRYTVTITGRCGIGICQGQTAHILVYPTTGKPEFVEMCVVCRQEWERMR